MKVFEKYFDDFIGYLIILNVLHQILISGYSLSGNPLIFSQYFILFSFQRKHCGNISIHIYFVFKE